MAVQKEKAVARARKLLSLAASPEPHEAARAREAALEFMARHGLTEDDVAEDVTEVVDERPRASHRALAEAAATAYEVAALSGRRGEIAFRGTKARIALARECYRSLMRASYECANDYRVSTSPPNVRQAWFAAAWRGYVETIMNRCRELREERRRPKVKRKVKTETKTPPPEIDFELTGEFEELEAVASFAEARRSCDTSWLYREAYALGQAVAMRADLSGNAIAAGGMLGDGRKGDEDGRQEI